MNLLNNKIALITGGTSGIGKATAIAMANEGAKVIITGRNNQNGEKVVSDILSKKGVCDYIECDVSNLDSVSNMKKKIQRQYDHIDILFNNAGAMLPSTEIEKMPVEDWKQSFDINVNGAFFVTRTLKYMIFACNGCIINNASIAGLHSYTIGRSYAYSASKAAIIQFTRQMAKNYGENGVRVNCICPGIIDTPMLGDRDRNEYAKRVPLGYVAKPEEVAKVVVFLASEYAKYVTGAVIPVDGGVSL